MMPIDNLKVNSDILNKVALIDEFKGEWKALKSMQPEVLSNLKKIATIESIGSSNRIEGNKLTDRQVEKLLSNLKTFSFQNRDEEEIAGYAELSNLIFDDYEIIPFNENYIKQLHSILLKYSAKDDSHKGKYKTISNSVSAFDAEGKEIGTIFETATPFDTPQLMEELIVWTNTNLKDRLLHPLIVIGIFVVNFLAIHPFQDGNGRLSRILTNLLLLKSGYNYTAYSSLESIIEDNKSSYYLALRETQATLKNKEPNYEPWLTFFIKSLEKQKVRLEYKLDHLQDSYVGIDTVNLDDLPEIALEIYKLFDNTDRLTIDYIKSKLDASESKIKRNLLLLQNKNIIKKHGVTKGSWYVKL